jgi:endoglucanase
MQIYRGSMKMTFILLIFLMCTISLSKSTAENTAGKDIIVNQLGYLPKQSKSVICTKPVKLFNIVDKSNSKIVSGGIFMPLQDPTSKQKIWRGDFSNFNIPGTYQIEVPGIGISYPFAIKPELYNDLFRIGTRFYYLQRCGTELHDDEAGLHHHGCHLEDGILARGDRWHGAGDKIQSGGGWHDAGDYGKYVTTTTVTVAQILAAFELWPKKFYDRQLGIPESGNGIPDVLDEARVGMEWLFTMQRPDGAVYHKLASKLWPGFNSPDTDIQARYIYGISTPDTGKFAATMAIAARVYKNYDSQLADRARDAAENAWDFLSTHPFIWDHNDFDDEASGAYASDTDTADRLWAALELSTLKKEQQPIQTMIKHIYRQKLAAISWSDASLLGYFNYARSPNADEGVKKALISKIVKLADQYLAGAAASGYGYTLKFKEFGWASNKEALARGGVMLMADILRPDSQYCKFALKQLDFILGLNPLSKCFVAGLGSNTVSDPHHRFAKAAGKAIPGALAGGPNNRAESGSEPYGQGPFSYVDSQMSFSSNEPAIDYNAALLFLSAAFVTKP